MKSLTIFFILTQVIISQSHPQVYTGNNYLPLNVGNRWQYLKESYFRWGGMGRSTYSLEVINVNSDTIIAGKKYYKFREDWLRYSEEQKKIYLWFNDSDRIYMDFTVEPGFYFSQFTPRSHLIRNVQLFEDSVIYSDTLYNLKGYNYSFQGVSEKEFFVENIGLNRIFSDEWDYSAYGYIDKDMIIAVLYDSSGAQQLYSNHYKPEVHVTPLTTIGSSLFRISFQANHPFNIYSISPLIESFNFLDSVLFQYYYKKGDSLVNSGSVSALHLETTNYQVSITVDTSLLKQGYTFFYRVKAVDKTIIPEVTYAPDSGYYSCNWSFPSDVTIEYLPLGFSLLQNYPNPFNPTTKIKYYLSERSFVKLIITDLLGREISVLVNEEQDFGEHEILFKADNLSSGVYFYSLHTDTKKLTGKMLLIK